MLKQFQATLRKVVDDEQYRQQVKIDPQRITSDFQFTGPELTMLVAVGQTANDDLAGGTRARMALGSCSSCGRGHTKVIFTKETTDE